jgi:hypothetical protein
MAQILVEHVGTTIERWRKTTKSRVRQCIHNKSKHDPSDTESGYRLTFFVRNGRLFISIYRGQSIFMTSKGIDILRVKLKTKNEVNGGWEQLQGKRRAFVRTVWTFKKGEYRAFARTVPSGVLSGRIPCWTIVPHPCEVWHW